MNRPPSGKTQKPQRCRQRARGTRGRTKRRGSSLQECKWKRWRRTVCCFFNLYSLDKSLNMTAGKEKDSPFIRPVLTVLCALCRKEAVMMTRLCFPVVLLCWTLFRRDSACQHLIKKPPKNIREANDSHLSTLLNDFIPHQLDRLCCLSDGSLISL